jgi:serine/threonine-protein kinase
MSVPTTIGKYLVQGVIGKGGMGAVYRGFDPAIQRHVAIKAINRSRLDENELAHVLARFRHEAQAVGRLVHPRIVAIYDFGEDGDYAYIVMELVHGRSLYDHLAQGQTYDIREVGEVIRQLLDALGYCHGEGVIHRDIKPSNILINNDGRIKLSDFGIAHIEASNLTKLGEVLGTPYYMAPEQFMGTETDHLADLYAVGVIAYELLTGVKPFTGTTATVMHRVLSEAPRNASEINPKLTPDVDAALQRALAKKREDRFQSAREFQDTFRDAIETAIAAAAAAPVAAPKPGGLARAARVLQSGTGTAAGSGAPLTPAPKPPSSATFPAPTRGGQKARILFVDDEERILTALKSVFRAGYHVFTTTDGKKALDFLSKHPVEVVVSDQRMPEMLGVELLREVKKIAPQSVRILLTGYSDLAAIVGSINDGEVYRFMNKPWDNLEIQRIMAEAAMIAFALTGLPAKPPELPAKLDEAIIVIDDDETIFRATREIFANLCPVLYAESIDSALATLQEQDVSVIIADVESSRQDNTAMFKLLKQEHPEILTIVMTKASDSELVIQLINQAQIFRFLNKPVNLKVLQGHVHAALLKYQAFRNTPALMRQHGVEPADTLRFSQMGRMILERLRSLRRVLGTTAPEKAKER